MSIFEKIKSFCFDFGFKKESENSQENNNVIDYLGNLKLADLKARAKSQGLKGYSRLKKAELLELLREK